MQSILHQLTHELERFDVKAHAITSLFIGGGTPSTIEAMLYEPFFQTLRPYLSIDAEITSEANPQSATYEWIETMYALGVNRLSLGVQSFNPKKLTFLGRNHTPHMALQAIENAAKSGINNISLDLMYGTALDTPSLLHEDLHIATSLPINHLSAYALTLEENTPFYQRHDVTNPSEKLAKNFVETIIQAGFPQYEISNFGRYQSLHNKGYWEHQNYLGIGSGAVGFLNDRRFYPSKDIETYIKNSLQHDTEILSHEDLHIERIFLGLRSIIGIALNKFTPKEYKRVTLLIQEKKLTCKNHRVYNPNYFLSDEIALFITQ